MKQVAVMLFIASIVVVPVLFVRWRNKRRRETWTQAATELALSYDQDLSMSGAIDGVQVFVAIKFKGTSAQKATVTRWTAQLRGSLPTGLDIRPEGILMKAAQAAGLDDEKLGIPTLDDKLIVRANSARALQDWVSKPGVQPALEDLVAHGGRYQLTSSSLWVEKNGQVLDVSTLTQTATLVARLARQLEG